MDELKLYKKMYATVIGEVDFTIQIIERALTEEDWTREKLIEIATKLKQALSEAEEIYLSADEEDK